MREINLNCDNFYTNPNMLLNEIYTGIFHLIQNGYVKMEIQEHMLFFLHILLKILINSNLIITMFKYYTIDSNYYQKY